MSRDIHISYADPTTGVDTPIEVPAPYFLFGTQKSSKEFWSIPRLREVGICFLTDLGHTDPVNFVGWEMMGDLAREIDLLRQHVGGVEFHVTLKAQWVAHLTYCYHLLVMTAPRDAEPWLMIG